MIDEYGVVTTEGLKELSAILDSNKSVTFCYSDDKVNAYIITITTGLNVVGTMPFFGKIYQDDILVSIHGRSSFIFSKDRKFFYGYVAEKLGLNDHSAKTISNMLNIIFNKE